MKEIWKGVKKKKIENKIEKEILRKGGSDTWGEEKDSERWDWKKNQQRGEEKEKWEACGILFGLEEEKESARSPTGTVRGVFLGMVTVDHNSFH